MKKKNTKKSATETYLDSIRIPVAPPSVCHTNKQNKRKKKFDYKNEMKHY